MFLELSREPFCISTDSSKYSLFWGSRSQPSTSTGSESLSQSESVGIVGTETSIHAQPSGQSGRFNSSDTESDDDSLSSRSGQNFPPLRKKIKQSKLSYQKDWKSKYLMLPAPSRDGKSNDNMICAQCQQHLKAKSSTALRHITRRHPDTLSFSDGKKRRLLLVFESTIKNQRAVMASVLQPTQLVKLAPYKLAFVLAKHKLPFSTCEAFSEFARSADPSSSVFFQSYTRWSLNP